MRTSLVGQEFIKAFEALRLRSYRDQGGVWTVGWGHTGGVKGRESVTKEKADEIFAEDLKPAEAVVNSVIKRVSKPVTAGMFDAMVSLAFNIGTQGFAHSTVAYMVLVGKKELAGDAFLMWNKVRGKTSKGLVARRKAERGMFLK